MVSPSCPRDRAADTADVSAAVASGIDAAASAIGVAVTDGFVGAVAALDASITDDSVASCNLDRRRGAWLTVCHSGLAHRLHLQPRFVCHPHGQQLARGLRHYSFLFYPIESSTPEKIHP